MTDEDNREIELKSAEEILKGAETESDHKGNEAQLQAVNNELMRNQIHQQQRLEKEVTELRESIDKYRKTSLWASIAVILLSAALLSVTAYQAGLI